MHVYSHFSSLPFMHLRSFYIIIIIIIIILISCRMAYTLTAMSMLFSVPLCYIQRHRNECCCYCTSNFVQCFYQHVQISSRLLHFFHIILMIIIIIVIIIVIRNVHITVYYYILYYTYCITILCVLVSIEYFALSQSVHLTRGLPCHSEYTYLYSHCATVLVLDYESIIV